MTFKVENNHKLLVPLPSTKLIGELTLRIQRFRTRLMRYDFCIDYVPGKILYTADALFRAPIDPPLSTDEFQPEVKCNVNAVILSLPASDHRLEEIRNELKRDDTLKKVMQYTQYGWPNDKRTLYGPIVKFWGERGNLSVHDGLLLRGRQLLIPPCLRSDDLRHLYDGHLGISKTRENAASTLWWPGILRDIERMVRECPMCEPISQRADRANERN